MKYIVILLFSMMLSSCICTARVSSIGTRRDKIEIDNTNSSATFIIQKGHENKYYELPIPYEFHYGSDEIVFRNVKLEKMENNALWYDGSRFYYDEEYHNKKIFFSDPYRKWWGYPSQALIIVTVPVDVFIDLVVVPVSMLFSSSRGTRGP